MSASQSPLQKGTETATSALSFSHYLNELLSKILKPRPLSIWALGRPGKENNPQ